MSKRLVDWRKGSALLRWLCGLFVADGVRRWLLVHLKEQFSPPVAFWGSIALAMLFALVTMWAWFPSGWRWLVRLGLRIRQPLGRLRWLFLVLLVGLFPYVVLFSLYRSKFTFIGVRWLLFLGVAFLGAFFFVPEGVQELTFRDVLASLLLTGFAFAFLSACVNVSSYPFGLSWSEGNRLWDYSLRFARDRYNYPVDQPIFAYIDPGRQLLWGLVYLIPGVGVVWVRLWSAVLFTVPYLVFGWVAFSRPQKGWRWAVWAWLWGFLFLHQGPIYTPLLLSALLVVLAESSPWWWVGFLVMVVAAYNAAITRFTWLFAPALWGILLAMGAARAKKHWRSSWPRTFWLAAGGILGAVLGGQMAPFWETAFQIAARFVGQDAVATEVPKGLSASQALIWSRLWPNPTFPLGILLGALLAVGPVILLWVLWHRRGLWRLHPGVLVFDAGILAVFFVIGVVASLKIGGGNNLHNLDMFLIGVLLFSVALWRQGGQTWFDQGGWNRLEQAVLLLLVLGPMVFALPAKPRSVPVESDWKPALAAVQKYVHQAAQQGEPVLFIDHRLLLTFGFVDPVPLVPEYEKKYMMDQAMAKNDPYFLAYYRDLAAHRFAVIITEPLHVHREQESAEGFAPENNAWVKRVARPTLCYYEPVATFRDAQVQILLPKEGHKNCRDALPVP